MQISDAPARPANRPRRLVRGGFTALVAIALISATMVVAVSPTSAGATSASGSSPTYFPQTGQYLGAPFLTYWQQHGGVMTFGYPISAEVQFKKENGPLIQYFQRAVFEYHPNAPAGWTVQLRLLGDEYSANMRNEAPFKPIKTASDGNCTFYVATSHAICSSFRDYWQSHGGLAIFGYPISDEFTENGLTIQYFQRARFEYHPNNPAKYQVEPGLLGSWAAHEDHVDTTPQPGPAALTATDIAFDATGAHGNTAWVLTSTSLLVTTDAGAHWSSVALPAGVSAGAGTPATAAYVDQSNALWLLTSSGDTATFYRAANPTSPWVKTTVSLNWPSSAPGSSLVPLGERTSAFGSSNAGVIVAEVTEGGAKTGPVSLILESTDNGNTFRQHDPPMLFGSWDVAYTSAVDGFASGYGVFHTTNGGKTWSPAAVSGYDTATAPDYGFGPPLAVGSRIYLPADVISVNDNKIVRQLDDLYVSDNSGTIFNLIHSLTVPPTDLNPPAVGVNGNNVWLIPNSGGAVAESSDSGVTWKTVATSALSGGFVENVGLENGAEATAWVLYQTCFDYQCTYSGMLLTTTDGGAHWQPTAAPPH